MRRVRERSPWLQLAVVFGGFVIGPYVALQVGRQLTPESELVQSLSVFAFALVFVGGTLLWTGLGIATAFVKLVWSLLRGRLPTSGRAQTDEAIVPPGYRSYVVLGGSAGAMVGVLAGAATDLSLLVGTALWTALGLGYGWLLWAAAHHGYLPFLAPE